MPYASLSDVPPQVATHKDTPLTLAQANWVSAVADAVAAEGTADEPYAVAWSQFDEAYEVADGAWVKKAAEEGAAQEAAPTSTFYAKNYHREARTQETSAVPGVEPLGDGDYRVEIMAHGLTAQGNRHYTKEALQAAVQERLFDGAKMYVNHEPVASQATRGHRDMTGWGATVKPGSVSFDGRAVIAIAHAHAPETRAFLDDPVAKKAVALSADVGIAYYPGRIDGRAVEVVERITKCHSVDFVPAGNAHGRVLEAASQSEGVLDMDIAGLTPEVLAEARPDLVTAIEARAQEAAKDDAAKAIETAKADAVVEYKREQEAEATKAAEDAAKAAKGDDGPTVEDRVQEAVAAKTAEQDKLIADLRDKDARRDTAEVATKLVQEAEGLTEASRSRIIAGFVGQIIPAADLPKRVQEAVEAAKAHEMALLKELGAGTQVRGAGATAPLTRDAQEAYEHGFRGRLEESGMSKADIDALMAVR